jgi:hypothetical protein
LWTAPTLTGSDPGHYCIMAFVNSAALPLSLTTSSGDAATVQSSQVGQKNLHIGPPLPPSPAPGGGGAGGIPGGRPFSEIIEFHNPETTARAASLVFDFRQLHPNIRTTVFFSPLDTATPLLTAVTGYTKVVTGQVTGSGLLGKLLEEVREIPRELDQIEDTIENRIRSWFGLGHEHDPDDTTDIDLPNGFNTVGWVAQRSGILEVRGVIIPAGGQVKALIMVEAAGPLPHGERYQFEVQQAVAGQIVGGSTYIVPVAGRPVIPVSLAPSDDELVTDAGRFLQPWLVQGWIDREKQQGKRQ